MNVYTVEISTEYSSKTTYDKFFIYRNFFTRSEAEKFIIEYLKSDDTELFDFITTYDSEIVSILEIESDPSFGQIEIIIRTTSSNKTIDTDIHLAKLNNGIKDILKTDSDPNSIYQFMLDNCYEGVDEYTADGYITRSYFNAQQRDDMRLMWGYRDIYKIYEIPEFHIGDAVLIDDNKVAIVCGTTGELKDSIDPIYWRPGYSYEGIAIKYHRDHMTDKIYKNGDPFASCEENVYHNSIRLWDEPIEKYSYLWMLRERALGRLSISEDELPHFHVFGTYLSTGVYGDPLYTDLPSIKAHIDKCKADID